MSEINKEKIQIHYYLKDESHSMDAFVRNRAEKNLIEAIKRMGELFGAELNIESEARKEGGLTDLFIFSATVIIPTAIIFLSPSINTIITHYFIQNTKLGKLDRKIKEETLKNLYIDSEIKGIELERIIEKTLQDRLAARNVSNFYKQMEAYKKVQKIGFKNIDKNSDEQIVERKNFKDFILSDNTTTTEDDEALIEIISPVLKEGKYYWKGKYLGEKIDFSMGDSKFKSEVISGVYSFANGSSIYCSLKMTTTYDELGEEKKRNYSVQRVYGTKKHEIEEILMRDIGRKKISKEMEEKQCLLFENNYEKNEI
jgi:hypothetical protein